ncbi:dihydrolipoamide acetyltransferase family protein [uncultured Megasphaera sp.]|uniref:dihydrolipoamide acetyltransferase family protein n=1 Tax=uncultured Megasphaera sp. TaxID=165188 RepID=UPI0026597C96|nr:dihydrolipoamide acetyltransferase family protein [uncultured Megasphaera sp.]
MAVEITMPQLGLTMTEGTVSQWLKHEGDVIKKGDEVVEIETDKISNVVEAHEDGVLLKIVAQEGDSLPVKAVLGYIGQPGEQVGGAAPAAEAPAPEPAAAPAPAAPAPAMAPPVQNCVAGDWVLATPYARKLAKDAGIDLIQVTGTGFHSRITGKDVLDFKTASKVRISPTAAKVAADLGVNPADIQADGRIMKADVLKAAGVQPQQAAAPAAAPAPAAPKAPAQEAPPNGEKLKGMRKVIAQRLGDGWRNTPHVHHTVEINMTEATALREKFIAMNKKFSFTDLIIKAMCRVLEEYTAANDSLVGDYIIHNKEIHMGVAVAIDGGLIVPVIKNANRMGLMEIHQKVGELAKKAREGKLSPDELTGGTCTISNLGMYGCDHFTPIVNPPEATILGVCRTVEKPVVVDHQIVIAPMMNAVLGYDHRIIDGAMAGLVTSRLREYLENPLLML